MYYTIYKVTNIINGKFYIGKHVTNNLEDGYMGSGKYLKKALNKYGLDNFIKEYLEILDSEEKMNLAEKIYVVLDSDISYNLCFGGQGGFSYINRNNITKFKGKTHTEVTKAVLRKKRVLQKTHKFTIEDKQKISSGLINKYNTDLEFRNSRKRKQTREEILKRSETILLLKSKDQFLYRKKDKTIRKKRVLSVEHKEKIRQTLLSKKRELGVDGCAPGFQPGEDRIVTGSSLQ